MWAVPQGFSPWMNLNFYQQYMSVLSQLTQFNYRLTFWTNVNNKYLGFSCINRITLNIPLYLPHAYFVDLFNWGCLGIIFPFKSYITKTQKKVFNGLPCGCSSFACFSLCGQLGHHSTLNFVLAHKAALNVLFSHVCTKRLWILRSEAVNIKGSEVLIFW